MTNNPLVSIVILNWNGIEDTLRCLESVKKLQYDNYEVIVVDNGSHDGSLKTLGDVADIKLVSLPKNTGFTGGHIEGLKHVEGDFIALLNNDLVVDPAWLTELVSCASAEQADIVGGRSYDWTDTMAAFDPSNTFSSYQTVSPITGHTVMLKHGQHITLANNLSGSNLLVSQKLIKHIGYLDNSFFAYYEETDFIARAKRAGYKTVYCPTAHVWHKSGASSKSIPYFYFYQMHRNRFRFAFKNYDRRYLWKFLWFYSKEVFGAFKQNLKHRTLHDTALIRAYWRNVLALPGLLTKRARVQRLGKTYSHKILSVDEGFDDVTIVVPCYNYANFVVEALDSIESQTLKPTEVVIVNDGSTDDSAEVIRKYIRDHQDSSITYTFIDQENGGTIATKNIALDKVTTSWMMFLDADDILAPDYLYKTVTRARLDNSDVVYTDMEMFGAINTIQTTAPYNKNLLRSVNFVHNSALMRTAVFKQVGGYKQKMAIGFEDWELYLSISELTNRFSYIAEPLLRYRRHEGASRDILAQNKMPVVVKYLEELHPRLYSLSFYYWLETYRLKNSLLEIAKYPFRLLRHTKSHGVKRMRSKPDSRVSRLILSAYSTVKHKKEPNL